MKLYNIGINNFNCFNCFVCYNNIVKQNTYVFKLQSINNDNQYHPPRHKISIQ